MEFSPMHMQTTYALILHKPTEEGWQVLPNLPASKSLCQCFFGPKFHHLQTKKFEFSIFSSGNSIFFFEKSIFQIFDIKKMRKKTLLSAKYILDSNKKKRKKKPISSWFLTIVVQLFDSVTNLRFLFNDVYIYIQTRVIVLVY